ncbi:MAG: hypothetical protein AABZ15_14105 [Nitrospirota bacterium]
MDSEQQEHKAEASERDTLAVRILRLEDRLDRLEGGSGRAGSAPHPAWPLALGSAALAFGYLGMGLPQHPYQYLFAGLLVLLAYHRGFLLLTKVPWRWPQIAVNFLSVALFFMIVLGGGVRLPFAWMRSPGLVKALSPEEGSWYRAVIPDYSVQWHTIPGVSDWSIDITKIQTFLLIATLAGALFRFQGFTSITALALLIVSIPVYLTFTWDWVVLFLVCGSVSLYLQSRAHRPFPEA